MSLNIKPSADRVVVEAAAAEEKTASGIIIPDTAKEKPQKGTIVAVGPGKFADVSGALIPMTCKVGDEVLYGKYAGTEITIDGKEYLIMRESDIYAVL
jgi:chaperonin GroES